MKHEKVDRYILFGMFVAAIILIVNQVLISSIASSYSSAGSGRKSIFSFTGKSIDVSDVDVSQIQSTQMAVALLFPELKNMKSEDDAVGIMIASGVPDYSEKLGGIVYDDPVTSLEYLAKWYPTIKEEAKKDPALWQRYLNLATQPVGISCEYCCGVGPKGISANGDLLCGCSHNPAIQALTLGLMKNTDYNDAEVLREAMKWKALWFPKNMVEAALTVAGKDATELKSLPGMVGGC